VQGPEFKPQYWRKKEGNKIYAKLIGLLENEIY
jgi:hypothetical protein